MIKYIQGDVTDAPQQVIAHGVNCAGGFGTGVAGAIKQKFPAIRDAYLKHEPKVLGTCQFIEHDGRIWVNAFTQQNYGYDGKQYADLESVGRCLLEIADYMRDHKLQTIAMPKIGCGRGGLKWEHVSMFMDAILDGYEVYIYEMEG